MTREQKFCVPVALDSEQIVTAIHDGAENYEDVIDILRRLDTFFADIEFSVAVIKYAEELKKQLKEEEMFDYDREVPPERVLPDPIKEFFSAIEKISRDWGYLK